MEKCFLPITKNINLSLFCCTISLNDVGEWRVGAVAKTFLELSAVGDQRENAALKAAPNGEAND